MSVSVQDALAQLSAQASAETAEGMAAYHKVDRPYLGVSVPQITDLATAWRAAESDVDQRVALAAGLWDTNIHEARIAAAKLLTQARIRPDQAVWELFLSWVPQFDAWAIADHACEVGRRRIEADPRRLDQIEALTQSDHMWSKRAVLVMTLPFARKNNPKPADLEVRERVLGWAADYATDPEWFIQKAVAWWVRDLSKHDPARALDFLDGPGQTLKSWARKEAGRLLSDG